jgi:hypothetical protein
MQIFGISNGFHIIDFEKREPIEQSRILLQKFYKGYFNDKLVGKVKLNY